VIFEERTEAEPVEGRRYPVMVRRMKFESQAAQVLFLRQMVNVYRTNQLIREKAIQIVFDWAKCPAKKKLCQAVAIARWVQTHIRYVNEPVETFQSPVRTLTLRAGDCDDFTSLICSLVESIAIPSELVALEWAAQFRHIFPRAVVPLGRGKPPRRIPLDATLNQDVRNLPNPIAIAIQRGDNPRALVL
jgi:transglutaminase-like putative cysteine protease